MYKVRQAVRKHRKLLSVCAMVLAIALMFWAVNSPAIVGVSAAKRVLSMKLLNFNFLFYIFHFSVFNY